MGDIADDCYDRALSELEDLECDPDYYGYQCGPLVNDADPWFPRARRSYAAPRPATTLSDFDVLPDDCSDLA